MDWTNNDRMKCNRAKYKELVIRKKCNDSVYPEMFNNKQYDRVTLLGVTFQSNCKFPEHVKAKLWETNKYLFVNNGIKERGLWAQRC